jgi:hypothetical protein
MQSLQLLCGERNVHTHFLWEISWKMSTWKIKIEKGSYSQTKAAKEGERKVV